MVSSKAELCRTPYRVLLGSLVVSNGPLSESYWFNRSLVVFLTPCNTSSVSGVLEDPIQTG